MKFFREGDKSQAFCKECATLSTTTFVQRTISFTDGRGEAKNILVARCDLCGRTVTIPAQSTPAIKRSRIAEGDGHRS